VLRPLAPDVADGIAAMHVLPGENCKARQMSVASSNSVTVVKNDCPSVAAHEVRKVYNAVGRSNDRLTVCRADVNSGVECAFAVKWINASRTIPSPALRPAKGSGPSWPAPNPRWSRCG